MLRIPVEWWILSFARKPVSVQRELLGGPPVQRSSGTAPGWGDADQLHDELATAVVSTRRSRCRRFPPPPFPPPPFPPPPLPPVLAEQTARVTVSLISVTAPVQGKQDPATDGDAVVE